MSTLPLPCLQRDASCHQGGPGTGQGTMVLLMQAQLRKPRAGAQPEQRDKETEAPKQQKRTCPALLRASSSRTWLEKSQHTVNRVCAYHCMCAKSLQSCPTLWT